MKSLTFIILSALFIFSSYSTVTAQMGSAIQTDPSLITQYVTDQTNTLTSAEKNLLIKKLSDFEKETSNQLVVYIVASLDGDPIEDVSMRIVEKNKIGQKDKDNGVLLLIAKNDRQLRIEVGYGLEGALPDAVASSIIRNEIVPEFKRDDYYAGIDKGVDAIISATRGEYTASETGEDISIPFLILVVFIVGFFFTIFIIGIIKNIAGYGTSFVSGGRNSGYSGGFWSSSGSSSGSSFSSFSGGGGSFGGGGASGSW